MAGTDPFDRLRAAVGSGGPSSDFDLNPELRPKGLRLRPAGVLMAFEETAQGVVLYLTKRASGLKHHPGQIAFPGGKVDAGDADVTAAALREAEEEIGLPRDHVEVFGTLPAHETVTGFEVTPVLARVHTPFKVRVEPGEVDEAFCVPYSHVVDPTRYIIEGRFFRGQHRQFYVVPWGPYYIWGATARMLRALAERVAS